MPRAAPRPLLAPADNRLATSGLKIGNGVTQKRDSTSGLNTVTQLRDAGFNAASSRALSQRTLTSERRTDRNSARRRRFL
jgi:hypothetical protein